MRLFDTVVFTFFLITDLSAQSIIYISGEATGQNNGTSWTDAFTNIQTGLTIATYGDQIWVAKGIYKPTSSSNRDSSFLLPNGVSLWGGFEGNETSISARKIEDNLTILSGDIGIQNDRSDNVYHVVTILGGDSLTVIDGFTIVGGNADGINSGGLLARNHGGGVFVIADDSHPVAVPIIRNCHFEENRAIRGGGIACLGNEQNYATPQTVNCSFLRNRAELFGGSIYKIGHNLPYKPFEVISSSFEKNYCQQVCGGIAVINPSGSVNIRNCIFSLDTGRIEVGGIYFEVYGAKTNFYIDSCEFNANYSTNGSGAITHIDAFKLQDTVEIVVSNSKFLNNHNLVGYAGGFASYPSAVLTRLFFENCIFESNYSQGGGAGIYVDPAFGGNSEINVNRCLFLENRTGFASVAGGFYYRTSSSAFTVNRTEISNSVFMYNDGAFASLPYLNSITQNYIVNCSFYRNGDIPFTKYWGVENNPINFSNKIDILNCVIWEPQTDGIERVFYNNDPTNFTLHDYLIDYSLLHLLDCTYDNVNPCQSGVIYGEWPNFVDSSGQTGLITLPNFPGYNRGSTIVADSFNLAEDFEGKNRIYCDTIDMGAYELSIPCSSSIFEKANISSLQMNLIQNPISLGNPVQLEFFTLEKIDLELKIISTTGQTIINKNINLYPGVPIVFQISSAELNPGLYLISVVDKNSRMKIQKMAIK